MEKSNISKPIATVLMGSNDNMWIQEIKFFLIGQKL